VLDLSGLTLEEAPSDLDEDTTVFKEVGKNPESA